MFHVFNTPLSRSLFTCSAPHTFHMEKVSLQLERVFPLIQKNRQFANFFSLKNNSLYFSLYKSRFPLLGARAALVINTCGSSCSSSNSSSSRHGRGFSPSRFSSILTLVSHWWWHIGIHQTFTASIRLLSWKQYSWIQSRFLKKIRTELKKTTTFNQYCGFPSKLDQYWATLWIRIRIPNTDPHNYNPNIIPIFRSTTLLKTTLWPLFWKSSFGALYL